MKQYRELIQFGDFYRLISPFEGDGNITAWMVVSPDKKMALVGYYRTLQYVNTGYKRVKLQGLLKDVKYQVSISGTCHYGDELINAGLIVTDASSGKNKEKYNGENGDYQSRIYILNAVE